MKLIFNIGYCFFVHLSLLAAEDRSGRMHLNDLQVEKLKEVRNYYFNLEEFNVYREKFKKLNIFDHVRVRKILELKKL